MSGKCNASHCPHDISYPCDVCEFYEKNEDDDEVFYGASDFYDSGD